MKKRVIVLVLDGCGAGAAPDAAAFGDPHQPSTVANVIARTPSLEAPTLDSLGFFQACGITSRPATAKGAQFGRLLPLGLGKDSVTGHWEMMGIRINERFPTYPEGFPIPLVKDFEERIQCQTLGNRPASGTKILEELGQQHVDTGCPILYTSADSVFQLAAHEDIIPPKKLYEWCRIAREILVKPNNVQRVIARTFVGDEKSGWKRTENRKDFPLEAPTNLLDSLSETYGIGVIPELFASRGFRPVRRTQNNAEHAQMLQEALQSDASFIFANFEDFDMLFGHRQDPEGFARCFEEFDPVLNNLLTQLNEQDLLILTADHGNDPTDHHTDHTREYVPVVAFSPAWISTAPRVLGDQKGLWKVGEMVSNWLGVPYQFPN